MLRVESTNDDSRLEMHCAAAMIVPPNKSLPYIARRGPAVKRRNFAVKDWSVLSETKFKKKANNGVFLN